VAVGRLARRTHIKYQPEDYHRPPPWPRRFPRIRFLPWQFLPRIYAPTGALLFFPLFFRRFSPLFLPGARPSGATNRRPFSHLPLTRGAGAAPPIRFRPSLCDFTCGCRRTCVTHHRKRHGIINELAAARAYRRAVARDQRSVTSDFVAAPRLCRPLISLFSLLRRERTSLHVTRTPERSVIYCVACLLSSYLLASRRTYRLEKCACTVGGMTKNRVRESRRRSLPRSVKTRDCDAAYISRGCCAYWRNSADVTNGCFERER